MPRQHPEPQQGLDQQEFIVHAAQRLNQAGQGVPDNEHNYHHRHNQPIPGGYIVADAPPFPGDAMPAPAEQQPRRRENREFTPDLWNEVQTLILELSNLKKKLIEKGVI